jgi:hypothetical protein
MAHIENWAEVCGQVTGIRPSLTRANWVAVELLVDSITDVVGYRNLLRSQYGPTTIETAAAAVVAAGVHENVRLCCRVARRTRDLIIAHPDHLQVEPTISL